ncbi:unnamed protein product [Phyllotreta striolata]|uniref:Magnesium-dependent phosphatase 1 n=1 Tax=Phyllotreta striolata TaxID=444603 RepID=A0A9N9TRW2_PHYSR|nr:unnamed protein product [Phyllotreta striolata]
MGLENLKLIVFDLDYTLWPFCVDSHISAPLRKSSSGSIWDSQKTKIKCYPEVPDVLNLLHNEGYILAVASRSPQIEAARQLIEFLEWDKYFTYIEIYPGNKTEHFNKIRELSKFSYNQMIFFDDEPQNIRDVEKIGVVCIFVRNGVNKALIEEGKRKYSRKQ